MLKFAQGISDVQGVGHHDQARLLAEFRDHRRRGAAAVDDDPRMLANPPNGGASDGLLVFGYRLTKVGYEFLRQGDRSAITAQQQTVALKRGEIFADRDFRRFEALGQLIHTDFALLIEQGEDVVTALRCIAFRHGLSFDSKDSGSNQNLLAKQRQARGDKKTCG
jgi:hypothetical protein